MVRRLIASMVVLACLLGILKPAIACADCVSRTDCCPAGSSADCGAQMRGTSPCAQASSCCALRAAISPSVSALGIRATQGHASGPSAIALPVTVRVGQYPRELQTPTAQIPDPINESLTYLRTARLRL